MVTRDNYFVSSDAEFRSIPAKWTRLLLNGGDNPVKLGNQQFHRTHTSVGYYGSFSAYWESADGSTLVRVSDHWCGKGYTRKTNLIPNIRSCHWYLRGHVHPVKADEAWMSVCGGIVRFRDMRELDPQS